MREHRTPLAVFIDEVQKLFGGLDKESGAPISNAFIGDTPRRMLNNPFGVVLNDSALGLF